MRDQLLLARASAREQPGAQSDASLHAAARQFLAVERQFRISRVAGAASCHTGPR